MGFQSLNDVTTLLASSLASGAATSAAVTTGDGALFASASTTNPIRAGFFDATTGALKEIVNITGRSTDTLTIVRAVEDATRFAAGTWTTGTILAAIETASTKTQLRPGLKSGQYYVAGEQNGSNLNRGNGVASVMPFWFPSGTVLTRLGVYINSAASAGGVFRFIVYADDGAGYPDKLISDAGTIVTTSAPLGVGLTGLSITVSGWVWIGGVAQGAPGTPATFYYTQAGGWQGGLVPASALSTLWNNATSWEVTGMTGAAPASFGTPSSGTQAYRVGVGL